MKLSGVSTFDTGSIKRVDVTHVARTVEYSLDEISSSSLPARVPISETECDHSTRISNIPGSDVRLNCHV